MNNRLVSFRQFTLIISLVCFSTGIFAQLTQQQKQVLLDFSREESLAYEQRRVKTIAEAQTRGLPMSILGAEGEEAAYLERIADDGTPIYVYFRNSGSQQTISVDEVKTGGSAGYNLTGAGVRLGIWDGTVRTSHQEFGGRASYGDTPGGLSSHGTHVAGTIAAGGVNATAQGMSHDATLRCYTSGNATAEMASAAGSGSPLVSSNHSYGPDHGWNWNNGAAMWSWNAGSVTEDWRHGAYLQEAFNYDQTARNAPFYTIVVAAGNENGSGTAGTHQHNFSGSFTDFHQIDGAGGGVDCLPNDATAKNVITVGNVLAIPGGYSNPGQVVLAGSSSRGPTDDGRIKPDVVAQGSGVFSCEEQSNTDYGNKSGTSMSAPAVTGAIGLLTQHWRNLTSPTAVLRSATNKALLIHTADEAGPNPGPDYQFGWGLVNIRKAAQLMEADVALGCIHIIEWSVSTGGTYTINVPSNGTEPLKATLVYTDLPGPQSTNGVIDQTTARLVNDLDLRITRSGSTWFPYRLNRAAPFAAATTGDNDVDNVEQIFIQNPTAGNYTLTVTPEGSISGGAQAFSLIISGNGASAINYNITAAVINDETTYAAGNSITIGGTSQVTSSGDLQLFSGNYIDLKENFFTTGSGKLEAKIVVDPCFLEPLTQPLDPILPLDAPHERDEPGLHATEKKGQ